MEPEESERMSVLLSLILEKDIGSQKEVEIRRKTLLFKEKLDNARNENHSIFNTGSSAEGFSMRGSDNDAMIVDKAILLVNSGQQVPSDSNHDMVLLMREAENCQRGYVELEVGVWRRCKEPLYKAFHKVGSTTFISSDIYREEHVKQSLNRGFNVASHGPSSSSEATVTNAAYDVVHAFHCPVWPKEALEWKMRTRLHGWPSETLLNKIVKGGCHVVPIGDKSTNNTLLQWRISFACAERLLVHSLNHTQFKVYGLFKILLKNIKECLENTFQGEDILSSYILKTIVFNAVENTPETFWNENNTFVCFWFCFNILCAWVKGGYCPQYFIPKNNLFKRHIHGENQQTLLSILTEIHQMKWMCLSVGTFVQPPIMDVLLDESCRSELMQQQTLPQSEVVCDLHVLTSVVTKLSLIPVPSANQICHVLHSLFATSHSEIDEFLTYYSTAKLLSLSAMKDYSPDTDSASNKLRYRNMKKYKTLLQPRASWCSEILYVATFCFLTGNNRATLEMCRKVTSSVQYYPGSSQDVFRKQHDIYMRDYCGRGYTLINKLQKVFSSSVYFLRQCPDFCLPQLQLEFDELPAHGYIRIPPLPYAIFLAFLSYHEIGDIGRRDDCLRHLIAVKYDEDQGGHRHWIVHTLLGICYQTVGDSRRAIKAYEESLTVDIQWNPALDRIELLER
ncbi:uncharacterized protein LOC110465754 isoform X1 [Mizuhopecten yessoensis]|uniref:Cyclic GMP-AMP synthase n=1 Tax=Mizuhopecten yessoensis TaxID=6573 RepID=A0A210R222_MIZYE|nr:uncharacterized protein LOC110465754 isoform X1 [Mizuhopecten yessoensis]OWF54951.1 Cyclic GMP-AMP synthase [Mizuhopecten yessoensis]